METTMSKYGELLALAEIFKKQGAAEAKAERPMRTKKDDGKVDLMALLDQKKREYEAVKTFVEQQNKLNKPEEKKPDGKWKLEHIAMFLIATSPITGPLYVWWFRSLLGT